MHSDEQRNLVCRVKQKLREKSQFKGYVEKERERKRENVSRHERNRENSCLAPHPLCLFLAVVPIKASYTSHEML